MAVETPHADQTKLTLASKLAIACLCAFGALLVSLACAGSAFASRGHEFTSTFGTPCILEPCTGESLKKPNGVAVNEATGDVYVVDEGSNRVVRFDKEGAFLSEFNGSGLLLGEGKAAGSGLGEVPTGRFEKPETIAVDNSCVLLKLAEPACKTEDPSNGDVYVVDSGHKVVDKYTPSGEYVGQIAAGEAGRFTEPLEGVAVDTSGDVWVYQEPLTTAGISGFNNATPNEFTKALAPNLPGFAAPGIAVDSGGNFYVRSLVTGHGRISKVAPSGTVLVKELDKEESSAVAVDQSNNNALVDNLTSIGVFNAEGSELERLGKEKGEGHLTAGAGIGVDAATSTIYVADSAGAQVVVFGPQEASAPSVESESFSEVTSASATLGAELNPRSEPGEAATKYRFQYERCPKLSPSSCTGTAYAEVPGSAGELAPDFEAHPVSATLTGLQPNSTYQFRVLAENAHDLNNPVAGEGRTFTTQVPGGEVVMPDGRGFELVSPPDKQGAQIEPISETGVVQAAASGSGITYLSNAPTDPQPEGVDNLSQNISTRGNASWSSRDTTLPHTSATGQAFHGQEYRFFDRELTLAAVQPFGEFNALLSPEASESTSYLRGLSGACGAGCFQPLVTGKPGFANVPAGTQFGEEENCKPKLTGSGATHVFCGPEFVGSTGDLSHVVLKSLGVALTLGGPIGGGLYEWGESAIAPVSVLPDNTPTQVLTSLGTLNGESDITHGAISSDGSRIAWSTPTALYQRDMASKETVQLDKAEEPEGTPCAGCVSGGGTFQFASADGSRVFFTDENKLTGDSGASHGEKRADIYECRIVLNPKLTCELSDATPKRSEEGAGVLGSVLGASEDGEYLYFVATGVQSGANSEGKSPQAGKPNLYLRHGASTSFIATLAPNDENDWTTILTRQPTRVSPSGQYLEFMSQARPTGYDDRDRATGEPTAEVYLYNASTAKLECASCDPTGERPVGVEYLKLEPGKGGLVGGPKAIWENATNGKGLVAANVPGWTGMNVEQSRYQPRYLNNQGRLFFNTVNPLVAQDSNGTQDVYEYEPPGIKGPEGNELCSEAAETYSPRSGGCVSLISSGKSTRESAFLDASESGDDVFFLTQARLSPIDTDNALDVYDAHVCTTALPCIVYPPPPPAPCSGESSCKAPISPQQIFGAPASSTFQGPGNLPPAPPAKPKPKTAEEVRIEKLSKALKSCRAKQNKAKRMACEKSARKRYAKPKAKSKAKAKAKAKKSRHSSKGRGK